MQTAADKKDEKKRKNIIPFIPDGDFYFTKGVEAFQKSKFDLSLKWLQKAVEASPDEALFYCQMSIVHTEIGSYHTANQILTEVLFTKDTDYIDCYYLIANNYAHLGLLQDAKKYGEAYLEKAPDGDFREEAASLLDFIEMDEKDEEDWLFEEEDELLVYQETAFYHVQRSEWDEAILLLEEMMVLFPDNIQAKHEYSLALFFSGEEQQGIELEKKWMAENPQSLFCHSNLAVFYYNMKNYAQAERHIAVLEKIYPIHEQQKLRVASTLAQTGRYELAMQRFKQLSYKQVKGHLAYFKWYSISAYRTGELSKALTLWEEGCRRHPVLGKEDGPWAIG